MALQDILAEDANQALESLIPAVHREHVGHLLMYVSPDERPRVVAFFAAAIRNNKLEDLSELWHDNGPETVGNAEGREKTARTLHLPDYGELGVGIVVHLPIGTSRPALAEVRPPSD